MVFNDRISKLIVNKLFGNLSSKKISILGFSFKANTNDTRNSPCIDICKNLLKEGAYLSIFDPKVSQNQIVKDFEIYESTSNEKENWKFCHSIKEATKEENVKKIDFKDKTNVL